MNYIEKKLREELFNKTADLETAQAKLDAVRLYVEEHAGDGIDGDHVAWFQQALGEK